MPMRRGFVLLLYLLALLWTGRVQARQAAGPVELVSPRAGQVLQGEIPIAGSTAVEGFVKAEVSFSHAPNPTGTWFLIAESSAPVENGLVAHWDTAAIVDGSYNLRLLVSTARGELHEARVDGLQVRNQAAPLAGDAALPAAPRYSPNPAQLAEVSVWRATGLGVLAALGSFGLVGLYALLRYGKRD